MKDLIGQKFNKLTVIEKVIDEKGKTKWRCKCDCGNEKIIRGDSLRSGHTKSCGCLQREHASQLNALNLIGKTFGRLTVVERSDRKDKSGSYYWFCDCECGTKHHEVSGKILQQGRTLSCGCLKSKGEEKIAKILTENNIKFSREYIPKNFILSTGGMPRFDFAIENSDGSIAYLIEYQGEQHFTKRENGYFTSEKLEIIQKRDKEKEQYCKDNSILLFYINYYEFETFTKEDIIFRELIY